jgi:hypothetical protein
LRGGVGEPVDETSSGRGEGLTEFILRGGAVSHNFSGPGGVGLSVSRGVEVVGGRVRMGLCSQRARCQLQVPSRGMVEKRLRSSFHIMGPAGAGVVKEGVWGAF